MQISLSPHSYRAPQHFDPSSQPPFLPSSFLLLAPYPKHLREDLKKPSNKHLIEDKPVNKLDLTTWTVLFLYADPGYPGTGPVSAAGAAKKVKDKNQMSD